MTYSPLGQKIASVKKIHASRSQCEIHAHRFLWLWPLHFKFQFTLSDRGIVHGVKSRIGSKNSCKYGVDVNAFTPSLVGMVFQFWRLWSFSNFPFGPWTVAHGVKKSAQNICY